MQGLLAVPPSPARRRDRRDPPATVSLGGVGNIIHVIHDTGARTASNTTPSDVVSYR